MTQVCPVTLSRPIRYSIVRLLDGYRIIHFLNVNEGTGMSNTPNTKTEEKGKFAHVSDCFDLLFCESLKIRKKTLASTCKTYLNRRVVGILTGSESQ